MQFPHTDQRVYISVSPNAISNIQRTLQLQAYLVGVGGLGLVGVGLLLLKLLLEILLHSLYIFCSQQRSRRRAPDQIQTSSCQHRTEEMVYGEVV
jgi:hypothetical protein